MDTLLETMSVVMLDLLSKNADIQSIINTATELLGNPLVVIDSRFRILYSSTNVEVNIELWKKTLEERYVSESIITSMVQSQIIGRLQEEEQPVEHEIPDGYRALRMPIFLQGRYGGFVGVYDYLKPMGGHDGECLRTVCKAVTAALYLDKDFLGGKDLGLYEAYLYDLIRCGDQEQAKIAARKNQYLSFGERKILICIGDQEHNTARNNIPFGRIRDILSRHLYLHYSVTYDNKLVMLFCLDQLSDTMFQHTLESIGACCGQYHLQAGVSFEFMQDENTPFAYHQAVYALGGQSSSGSISMFEDHMMDYVMEKCLQDNAAQFFKHPAIQQIQTYDAKYNTHYYDTLKVYLENFCSLKDTATALGIHYNTMKYRINALEDIIGQPLRENKTLCKELFWSIQFVEREEASVI